MACGLLAPTAGSVTVAGVDVHQNPELAQSHIGYLSDFFSVYDDLRVWEYLDYFGRAYKMPTPQLPARIDEVIEQVGLEVKRDVMSRGLSRGMKQRLGIARAIIHKPKVLLLDEPASGLDPKARADLRNLLLALRAEGTTVLISSHILPDLEGFCTSIGVMEKGQMVRSGKIEELTSQDSKHHCVVRLSWVGDAPVEEILRSIGAISEIAINHSQGLFRFAGSNDELAALLQQLIAKGIRVLSFAQVKQTIEDVYLKLSRNEVM
jgi:ABC-2 type transport system ATP-binding protein